MHITCVSLSFAAPSRNTLLSVFLFLFLSSPGTPLTVLHSQYSTTLTHYPPHLLLLTVKKMLADTDLAMFVNSLGSLVFFFILAYHYVAVNHPDTTTNSPSVS